MHNEILFVTTMVLSTSWKIVLITLYAVYVLADSEDKYDSHDVHENEYTVELLILVDKSAYVTWYNKIYGKAANERKYKTIDAIQNHYSAVVHDINSIFKGAESHGLYLQVKLVGVRVITDEGIVTSAANVEGVTHSPTALYIFLEWIRNTEIELPTFDHAVLVTGLDLQNHGDTEKTGRAFLGSICKDSSVSLVENNFSHSVVTIMAHELGHSLGVMKHDGQGNDCDAHNFLMATSNHINSKHRWELSRCSVDAIKIHLLHLTRNNEQCLMNNSASEAFPAAVPLGKLYTPDSQCALIHESDSSFCRDFYTSEEDYHKMCQAMYCRVTNIADYQCFPYMGSDGFVCGDRKVCMKGKCVPKVDAPSVVDNCPQGDQPGIVNKNYTCAEAMPREPFLCYGSPFIHRCCMSCKKIRIAEEPDCAYGDKSPLCPMEMSQPGGCYKNETHCCSTCKRVKDLAHPDCYFGDKGIWCKKNLKPQEHCHKSEYSKYCCKTCRLHKSHQ